MLYQQDYIKHITAKSTEKQKIFTFLNGFPRAS